MTITDEQVRRLDLADARAALLEEILATPGVERTPRTVRPAVAMVAAAAAVAAVIAVPALLQHDEPVAGTPIAAEPTAAGPAYRAVLDAPGWRLESLNESDSDGEVGYVNADRDRVSIWWNAAGRYGDYLRDRQDVSAATPVEVLGGTAPSWAYSATDHATMIEPHDGYYLEVRVSGTDLDGFRAVLAQLRRVDEAGFARTLPAEMVTPDESAAEVEQILADVPLPPGLTPAEVRVEGYQQRYHVIAAATDAALCGWVDVLVAADRDGDRAAQREARAALETVRDWDALPETLDEGDWAPVMYQAGDDAQAGLPGLTLAERYCSG